MQVPAIIVTLTTVIGQIILAVAAPLVAASFIVQSF